MRFVRIFGAWIIAALATYVVAAAFNVQQVIAKQAKIGMVLTSDQQLQWYLGYLAREWAYGLVLAAALLIGFLVAALVKRVLKPLAPVAYPVAGAAAVVVAILLIESLLGGGAGVIAGARGALGLALQGLAGALGGFVFALLRPRR